MSSPSLSFEFFPPKTDPAREELRKSAENLAALSPLFMTVTYGAAGATREGTLETCADLCARTRVPMGSHLTYLGTPKPDLFAYASRLWDANIRHLVALRGDVPEGADLSAYAGGEYFHYTSDFVEALLALYPFDISVGAYPEKHLDAPTMADDLIALRKKCEAGAARAITQFFFDNEIYYRFLDLAEQAGIKTPIVPGLMPILDFTRIKRFAGLCGASVPRFVEEKFSPTEKALTPQESAAIALDLLTQQVADLLDHGVSHFHFYTLNRPDLAFGACRANGLGSGPFSGDS